MNKIEILEERHLLGGGDLEDVLTETGLVLYNDTSSNSTSVNSTSIEGSVPVEGVSVIKIVKNPELQKTLNKVETFFSCLKEKASLTMGIWKCLGENKFDQKDYDIISGSVSSVLDLMDNFVNKKVPEIKSKLGEVKTIVKNLLNEYPKEGSVFIKIKWVTKSFLAVPEIYDKLKNTSAPIKLLIIGDGSEKKQSSEVKELPSGEPEA